VQRAGISARIFPVPGFIKNPQSTPDGRLKVKMPENEKENPLLSGLSPSPAPDSGAQPSILDALPAHIALLDTAGVIVNVNEPWKRFAEENAFHGAAYCVGENYITTCERAAAESAEARAAAIGIRAVLRRDVPEFNLEYPCHSAMEQRWFAMSVSPFNADGAGGAVVAHVNVTKRKLAEIALRQREERLSAILMSEPECVKITSLGGILLEINPAGLAILEADDLSQAIGRDVEDLIHPDDKGIYAELHRRASLGETNQSEFRIITLKGSLRWVESHSTPLREGGERINSILTISRDITQRKLAEEKLRLMTRLYAVASGINEAIIREGRSQELFETACRIAVEQGGLVMAWVGLADDQGALKPAARHGRHEGYLDAITVTISETKLSGLGPGGNAFRLGAPAWVNNIALDNGTFGSRREALERGYQSCAAFPLKRGGASIGVFVVYSDHPDYFTEEEIKLLNSLAENISFAIDSHEQEAQRARTEMALKASEMTMSIAQRIAHFGSWELDFEGAGNTDGGTLRWSDEMFRIAGYEPGSVAVTNDFFFKHIPAEDQSLIRAAVEAALSSHKEYSVEHRFIRANGETRLIREIAKVFYDRAGRAARMVGTAHDITEQKKSDEALRFQAQLLDVAREAVMVRDLDDRIIYWNKGAERTYGWTSEEALGKRPAELLDVDPTASAKAVAATLKDGRWEGEMQKRTKSGQEITVATRWTLVRGEDGQPKSVLCISADVTDKKKLEAQFLRAQRMESIGTLAGGIAHDLNNILAPILMSIELLSTEVANEDGRALLETIRTSAQRGADMVKQVLSFARGVDGKRVSLNPVHILRDIQKIARDTFPKNIAFALNPDRDIWTVSGDPTQLHQVFMNLCVNARDAMPQGGKLTITVQNAVLDEVYAGMNPDAAAGSYLMISVADTGMGMSQGIRNQIFDPFFTTKEIGRGTGLGLSTTLAIVKGHGGFISVYSEPNKGATFKVYLPTIAAHSGDESAPEDPSALPRGRGETILLVDDEESVRIIGQRTLERFGYAVLTANNGAEALSIYVTNQSRISLVLTDMAMPIMDGVATIIALRSLNPHVRIVGSSGLASNSSVAKAIGAGVQLFIPKPYTADALLRTIHQALTGTADARQSPSQL
jgi:PAS domain S-box-containing protein